MYVIQSRFREWDKWETYLHRGPFETIDEARKVIEKMPFSKAHAGSQKNMWSNDKVVKHRETIS